MGDSSSIRINTSAGTKIDTTNAHIKDTNERNGTGNGGMNTNGTTISPGGGASDSGRANFGKTNKSGRDSAH